MAEVTAEGLARSSAYAMIAQVWRVASRFILTPLIIAQLGLDGYGVWTLLFAICAYVGVMEVNFGLAYIKLTAEYDAKRDYPALAQILGSGMTLVGSIGVVALTALWLCREPILRTLGVSEGMLPQAGPALLLVSICVLLRMSIGCVFPVLTGLQRLDLRHKTGILASTIDFAVSIILLYRGWQLMGLAVGHLCGQVVGTAVAWRLCRRLCPPLRISPFNVSLAGLRQVVSLGGRFQLLTILRLLIHQGTQMVISALLGPAMLGIAALGGKLISLGMTAGGSVIAPVMPAFSNLQAIGDRAKVQSLYERGSKLVVLVCVPCFAFLGIFADRLILVWTGQEYPLAAWTVRWIAPVAFASILNGMAASVLRARGTIRLEVACALISAAVLALLYLPGYWLLGYPGMICVEVMAGLTSAIWFLAAFARAESLDFRHYLRETVLRPLIVFGPLLALTTVFEPMLRLQLTFASPRWCSLVDVVFWCVLFGLVAALCGWFGFLSKSERGFLARHCPGGKNPALQRVLRCAGDWE